VVAGGRADASKCFVEGELSELSGADGDFDGSWLLAEDSRGNEEIADPFSLVGGN
jgi:hypothetical protein